MKCWIFLVLVAGCSTQEPPERDPACALSCIRSYDACRVKRERAGDFKKSAELLIDCIVGLESCVKACPVK